MSFGPFSLCGWRVTSDLPLPELQPWSNANAFPRLLHLTCSEPLQAPSDAPDFRVTPEGDAHLHVPGVAHFVLPPGNDRVLIHTHPEADPVLLRGFLYGSVLAVLCYRHGFLPLYGSSVLIGGQAIVLSGESGVGKSTTAMALVQRDHPLLSDDVCALDLIDPKQPMLLSAFPRAKLLEDSRLMLGLESPTITSPGAHGTKSHFSFAEASAPIDPSRPVPVVAIYSLDTTDSPAAGRTRLSGIEVFAFLEGQAHRAWMGRSLGFAAQIFQQLCTVAAAVPVYRLDRPRSLARLGEVMAVLENAHLEPALASDASKTAASFEEHTHER